MLFAETNSFNSVVRSCPSLRSRTPNTCAGAKPKHPATSPTATANYQAIVTRNSVLKEYALWRLARIARSTGDLPLERERLRQLLTTAPSSLFAETAALRLSREFFRKWRLSIAPPTVPGRLRLSKNTSLAREALLLTGESLARAGKTSGSTRSVYATRDADARRVASG